jgi:hypothetical protein
VLVIEKEADNFYSQQEVTNLFGQAVFQTLCGLSFAAGVEGLGAGIILTVSLLLSLFHYRA